MLKFKQNILIIGLILGLGGNLQAKHSDYIGTSTGKLMEIEVDSRVNALGGAYCGYVSDLVGYEANIAGIADLDEKQFVLAYYDWLEDTSIFYGAFGMPVIKKGVAVTSIKFLNIPSFVNKNDWGENSGDINIGNYVFSLGFGYKYFDNMKLGINMKYNRQSYSLDNNDILSFSSLGFDFAVQYKIDIIKIKKIPVLYKTPFDIKNLQLGFALQNIGFNSSDDSLPRKIKLGLSYPFISSCSFLFDINKNIYTFSSLIDSDIRFNFGLEYNYKKIFYIRGGVKLGYDMNSFTIGAGFQTQIGSLLSLFNYSYNSHQELGHINNFSLSTRFKKLRFSRRIPPPKQNLIEYHYYRGIAFFIEGALENAIIEWKKILIIDPAHAETLERIEEAQEILKEQKEIIPGKR